MHQQVPSGTTENTFVFRPYGILHAGGAMPALKRRPTIAASLTGREIHGRAFARAGSPYPTLAGVGKRRRYEARESSSTDFQSKAYGKQAGTVRKMGCALSELRGSMLDVQCSMFAFGAHRAPLQWRYADGKTPGCFSRGGSGRVRPCVMPSYPTSMRTGRRGAPCAMTCARNTWMPWSASATWSATGPARSACWPTCGNAATSC